MDERLLDCPGSRILAVILEATPVETPREGLTATKETDIRGATETAVHPCHLIYRDWISP
jgi:hypothetical protein